MHNIILKPGTGVINVRQFKLPKSTQQIINDQMRDLKQMDVIIDSRSPHNLPTFTVPKKDDAGGKTDHRVVHDYRRLNSATIVQDYPMPVFWDLIDNFEHCNFFTCIDIKSAFLQIPMNPDHQELTAFTVGYNKLEYQRMPFGAPTLAIIHHSRFSRPLL